MDHYAELIKYLDFDLQRNVSTEILKQLLKSKTRLENPAMVERMMDFVAPIVKDQDGTPDVTDDNKFEFEEEQYLMARFVHAIKSEDTDQHFKVNVCQFIIHHLGTRQSGEMKFRGK